MQTHCSDPDECPTAGLLFISRGTSILLLGVYSAYLWFQACSNILFLQFAHQRFSWNPILISSLRLLHLRMNKTVRYSWNWRIQRKQSLAWERLPLVLRKLVLSFVPSGAYSRSLDCYWSPLSSHFVLNIVSLSVPLCSLGPMLNDLIVPVVASIEETAVRYSIPKTFIGVILLPIVVCFKLYPPNCLPTSFVGKCRRTCHFSLDGNEE